MANETSFLSRSVFASLPHMFLLWALSASFTRTEDLKFKSQYLPNEVVEEPPEIKPCSDNQKVCTSLFRYDGQTVLQEGQYCACPGCSSPTWDEEDGMSFTWFHHERGDRLVQYRFCDRVIPKYECKEDRDVAAIIRTTHGWNPFLKKIWCRCPNSRYVLKGWNKVTEDGESFWEYTYTCKKVTCELDRPCVRRYMNAERSRSKGYKFLCSCPDGQRCPTQTGPSKEYDEVTDESGEVYTNGYCRRLTGAAEPKPTKPTEQPSTSHPGHAHAEP